MMLKQVLGEYYFVADFAMYFIWSGGSYLLMVVSFVLLSVCWIVGCLCQGFLKLQKRN